MTTTQQRHAANRRASTERQVLKEIDDRFGGSTFLRGALDHIFPDHWSFMVGEIAMYTFVILVVTGIYLALFFKPSETMIIYHGVYKPLYGQKMSEAYASTINLSFNVRAGLFCRQVHHWAAIVFMAALAFHASRVFFTGAFRKPRETNWIIGLTLLTIVMLEGFSGYSLPDDLLSGTGLRVLYSILLSIPLIGAWVSYDIFGSTFPGTQIIPRLFVVHEFLFPLAIAGLLGAHLAIIWRQTHTDFPGPGKTERNIVGSRVWPQYAAKSTALLLFVAAVLCALGGFVQINPIWLYGPYIPYMASSGSQPDWYVGWLDGALRLWPHWEFRSLGVEIANPFFPGLLVPGIVFTIMYAWPIIDRFVYRDHEAHHLLDRPRDKPFRTAVGVAALIFFAVLTIACGSDILANNFYVSYELVIEILQYGAIIGPFVGGMIAYRVCLSLQRRGSHPLHQPVAGIIVRSADGAYHTLGEVHHGEMAPAGNGHAVDGEAATNGHNGDGAPEEVAVGETAPAAPVGEGTAPQQD